MGALLCLLQSEAISSLTIRCTIPHLSVAIFSCCAQGAQRQALDSNAAVENCVGTRGLWCISRIPEMIAQNRNRTTMDWCFLQPIINFDSPIYERHGIAKQSQAH
jgi:hypothetical protein